MSFSVTVVSAVAFIIFVFLVSFLPFNKKNFALNIWQFICCVPLLLTFFFIPVGFLPAFVQMEYSCFIIALLCACSVILQKLFIEKGNLKLLLFTLISFTFLVLLLRIALNFGFPGAKYSLDMLCNADLWGTLDVNGKIFAVLSMFCFVYTACLSIQNCDKIFAESYALLCCAIITSIIFPILNPGCRYGFCYMEYLTGFVSFWLIVFVLRKVLMSKFNWKAKH